MRYYETLYIINPNLSDEEISEEVAKFNRLVENLKGVIIKVDEWGKKNLAYKMKKLDKGYYVLLEYCGEGSMIAGLERALKLDERILEYQTVKLGDDVDPEELKSKDEEGKGKETESAEDAGSSKDSESETGKEEK